MKMTPNEWILSSDTGISSKTIWAVMMGAITGREHWGAFDIPHDPDDFGRCYRLLQHIPEWRSRLNEVVEIFPIWGPMVREWDKLTLMYIGNLPRGREYNDEMYKFMSTLREEGHIADGWKKTGPYSWQKEQS